MRTESHHLRTVREALARGSSVLLVVPDSDVGDAYVQDLLLRFHDEGVPVSWIPSRSILKLPVGGTLRVVSEASLPPAALRGSVYELAWMPVGVTDVAFETAMRACVLDTSKFLEGP